MRLLQSFKGVLARSLPYLYRTTESEEDKATIEELIRNSVQAMVVSPSLSKAPKPVSDVSVGQHVRCAMELWRQLEHDKHQQHRHCGSTCFNVAAYRGAWCLLH